MAKNVWVECGSWEALPVGEWLVKVDSTRGCDEYHIACCTSNSSGHKLTIVGGHFSFDMPPPIAYTTFDKYGEDETVLGGSIND